jgi:hypothetical protein
MAKDMREGHWVRTTNWDGTRIAGNDNLVAIRAQVLKGYAKVYWPTDLARQWVRDGWESWLSKQPKWFTEKWKARVPVEEWLAGSDRDGEAAAVVPLPRQERSFLCTISNQSDQSFLL